MGAGRLSRKARLGGGRMGEVRKELTVCFTWRFKRGVLGALLFCSGGHISQLGAFSFGGEAPILGAQLLLRKLKGVGAEMMFEQISGRVSPSKTRSGHVLQAAGFRSLSSDL